MDNIKEEFISTLSHEIRTPLTSIKGFSQTMLSNWDKLDDNKKKEFIKITLEQSQRLINLVENVLNVAKIDSDFDSLVLVKADINQLVNGCIKIVSMNYKDFVFNFDEAKNTLFSYVDTDKTQQVILNILDNGAKYSINSKKIDVKTYNKNNYNIISIKNYGTYIDDKNMQKIFEKFYRINSYINSSAQGSGLGLYIANNLVKKMQGKIEVKSCQSEKTVEFLVYLPIYEVEKLTKNIGV